MPASGAAVCAKFVTRSLSSWMPREPKCRYPLYCRVCVLAREVPSLCRSAFCRRLSLNRRFLLITTAILLIESFPTNGAFAEGGIASVYSTESGSRTASGQRLNPGAFTAAHRSLPFGTKVLVSNRRNGRSVVVTINDRGPFVRGRVIDVTPAAARVLGFSGLAPVTLLIQ